MDRAEVGRRGEAVAARFYQKQGCLLVAHNGIARVVQSYFYDMTNEEYAAAGIKNCAFVEFTF